ncbi:class I SAM-dependent rRNA methyltransferase [Parasphaerochaeta coccoides]|uniref:PUA domain containing protein n=1 Tax=Parasphaerochaeta coccoides (strain ATCC BAA-1237 / DSM 17374 / SPN1) TaxID=760011 RepID=F4GJH6_PARC1|nr:class I SAM-dependent rRNA methyltransferase [Parasphaerochaeta coccoides]AEC02241.1 PUA domain containing protein [Parasphaerochaeta coccoides DSM 17374]
MENITTIIVDEGKEKLPLKHHPWIFSGAIASVSDFTPEEGRTGTTAQVRTADGHFIAWGWYDPQGSIPVRLLEWKESIRPDDGWWVQRLQAAILRRKHFFVRPADGNLPQTTSVRLVHGEADMLPGIVIDILGSLARVIISARAGWDHRDVLIGAIEKLLSPSLIIMNTDAAFTAAEKLPVTEAWYKNGERYYPEGRQKNIRFRENGFFYEINPGTGQKSGFYCDQRDNRAALEKWCVDARVLDAFSYTGGFTLHALGAGAKHVHALDSSSPALRRLLANVHINSDAGRLDATARDRVTIEECNVFEKLRDIPANSYDVVILDPPKLAPSKSHVEAALKAYKDINRLAMNIVKDGGVIFTFSCSGAVDRETFRTTLAWAAADAKIEVQILQVLGQAEDHPVRISFPESEYLSGYVLRVIKN